jgi:hypothetical protein
MNKTRPEWQKSITKILLIANACVLFLYVSGWVYPRAQSGEKNIKGLLQPNQPVEINVKVKGKAVKLNEKFEGETNWLRDIVLEVKNTSNKPIDFLRLDIDFPESRATGRLLLHQIFLGRRSDVASLSNKPPLRLTPGESLTIPLASEYERISRLIRVRYVSVETMNEINIALGEAMFDDGTLWSGGDIFMRNPDSNSPRKWIRTRGQGTN